jgi:DNA-binding winged helix-turn-helix (wHTH) protein/tetratricopeptide (TPR) repeat protein
VDPGLARLERGGQAQALQPKILGVLLHLIQHRDRVVTREELFASVWPGVVVSDSALTRAVSVLRSALGENAADSRVIRTVARRGYRLVAEVEELAERPAPAPSRALDPFVGRAGPLSSLEQAWDSASAGRGRIVVISGEAGIGKTRLAEELCARVRGAGGRALAGFCPSTGGAPPFWPWARALRGLDEHEGPGALAAAAAAARVDLGDLLPEHAPPAPAAARAGSVAGRFAVFDALDRLLGALAAQQPLLLVLDDLHWADASSLKALELVVRGIAHSRLLLVAIYREGEIDADHPLRETLAGLARATDDLRLHLDPLPDPEAEHLLRALATRELAPDVVRAIRTRSAGNPLFLRELVRAFTQDGALPERGAPLPPGIGELLRSRVERLPVELRRVLVAGAILGSEFEADLLRELVDLEPGALSQALDAAVEGAFLRPVGHGPLRYGFAHPLVQEALRRTPPPPERAALHACAAAALAARPGDAVVERLAQHHLEMARDGHPDARPAEHARRAAELAERRLAFDEAVRWFERALDAEDVVGSLDETARGELLVGLARTRWTVGDRVGARAPAEAAAALARRSGNPELLARAALVFWVRGAAPQDRHPAAVELLEEAARGLAGSPGPLLAEVLAHTAEHLWVDASAWQRTISLCEESLRLARSVGRPDTLYTALYCTLFATWPWLPPARRRGLADELMATSERLADPSAGVQASALHLTVLIQAGEIADADAEIARFESEIERFAVPSFFRWYGPLYRAMRAILAGRLELGERLALESFGHAQRAHVYDATRALAAQMFQIRSDQGRLGDLEEPVRSMAQRYPDDLSYVPLHAYVLAETDRADEARPIFERFVDRYDPSRDGNRCITGTILASVCLALGDADRAGRLYEWLVPEADLVTVNLSAWLCQGSLHWPLGQLAATRGDPDGAEKHLAEAERCNERIGARCFLARTRLDRARLRAEAGARADALDLAGAALDAAREIGMERLASQAETLRARLRQSATGDAGPIAR